MTKIFLTLAAIMIGLSAGQAFAAGCGGDDDSCPPPPPPPAETIEKAL